MRTTPARRGPASIAALTAALSAALLAAPADAVTKGTPAGNLGEPYGQTARITIGDNYRSCSGTLIDDQWIVTAASCFADNPAQSFRIPPGPPSRPTTVRLSHEAVEPPQSSGRLTRRVIDLRPREDRDLVFAKLESRVRFPAARLPSRAPSSAEALQIAGFGRTATDWRPGQTHVANTAVAAVSGTTFTVSGDSDTCRGDAGGPAYRGDPHNPELAGVHGVSWQKGCFGSRSTRSGSTEARVDDLTDWFGQHNPDQFITCSLDPLFFAKGQTEVTRTINTSVPNSTIVPALDGIDHWTEFGTTRGISGLLKAGPDVAWTVHQKTTAVDPFNDGDLRLWDTTNLSTLTGGERVATGWQHYLSAANRDKVTVDEKGRIYRIDPNGDLRLFVWDKSAKRWHNDAGVVLDTGWNRFNSITAAGDGVLYSRTSAGALVRFHYNHTSRTWTQKDHVTPGNWNGYAQLVSPGGDIMYGTLLPNTARKISWTRYNPHTNSWVSPVVVGQADHWGGDRSISVDPHSCTTVRP